MKYEYKTLQYKTQGIVAAKVNTAEVDSLLNSAVKEGWTIFKTVPLNEELGRTAFLLFMFRREAEA
jgi:hypothetical protein